MIGIGYKKWKKLKIIFSYFLITILTVCAISPIVWMFLVSIRSNNEVLNIPPHIIPETITFEAYKNILSDFTNIRSFINSIIVCLSVTFFSLFIASLASYGLSRFRLRGKGIFNIFNLTTQMLPPIFLLLSYFVIVTKLGIYDTYLGLIITYTSFTLPFCILMLKSYFDSIPIEIDEAAMIDGCSRWKVLLKIILPLNIPSLIATGAFAFIVAWSELLFAVTLTQSKDMRVLTVAIANNIGKFFFKWNELMAISVLSFIPLVIAWIFLQRYIIEGMTAGAIKY